MTGKFVFLHLSDLHFGDENENARAKRKNTLDQLLLTLRELPVEWKPQSIVISGDIGWSGIKEDYDLAETWIMELLINLGLSTEDIIPAPGNHDINLKIAKTTAAPSDFNTADELLELDCLEKVSEPFKGFEDFCKRMKIPPLTLGSKSSFLAGSREHKGMMWLVLNSAWFCRKGRMDNLYIGLPHLDVITAAAGWRERGMPTIGVLHHPPEYLHDDERYSYGRRITYDFLAGECAVILSGHAHGTLIDPDSKYQKAYLFTGGSSYSGERERNNFSIFRFDKSTTTIERRAYEWDTADGDWEHREKYSRPFTLLGGKKKPAPVVEVTRGGNEAEFEAYSRDYKDILRSLAGRDISEERDLHQMLFTGSRRHYEALRGENGRFCHLAISDIIIQEPKKAWIDSTVAEDYDESESKQGKIAGANRKLRYSIPRLWIEGGKHTVLKGEGGMGKTVSLVRLWDELTRQYDPARPVPVFIQLNEINTVPEEKRIDFILSTIRRNYFNSKVGEEDILQLLIKPRELPAAVLLLDGFNEVTVDNKELLIQVKKLMEQARGVQVVITSRYDMREVYGWEHLHLLELAGLEEAQMREYLQERKIKMPGGRLAGLLRNPMMLTLYASTCEVQEKAKYQGVFKRHAAAPGKQVETVGELLWNFMEAQTAVLLERLNYNQKTWWSYKFLMKFMLPAMGYEMEKVGLFAFDRGAFYGVLDTYCLRFSRSDFFETFADYAKYERALPTGACADETAQRERRSNIEEILCNVLFMVVKEGEMYRFLHQDFRDYFAALHVLHETEMGVKRGKVAEVLKERALPVYIRRFMGEIEGEHYQRPIFQEGKGWLKKENGASLLNRFLNLCRGVFDGSIGFGPWNIIEIWKEVRGELSGADLSELDLSRIVLNGVHCSRFYKSDYLVANFDRSMLHEKMLFPLGHSLEISSSVYSKDGEKILSASRDLTIKEWDVESGLCLKTFSGHKAWVRSAIYSSDGKKILSASFDKTIKEWDVESGQLLKTYIGHRAYVNSAVYSVDKKRILSASDDGTIIVWDVESGQCLKTFIGHAKNVNSVVYSGDGKKILSAWDDTIKEWDVESGQCLKTFMGHGSTVNNAVYNVDKKRILSASDDGTIKEWDVESELCVKTFTGHADGVRSAVYSGDGKRILSASNDYTVKEWDIKSGQCLKTFPGHNKEVTSAVYSNDRKKILSASWDQTIKEWDVESGQCLKMFSGYSDTLWRALYSGDGKKILSASEDYTIKEWDVESWQCVKIFTGHEDSVIDADYCEGGEKILSLSADQTLKEWNLENGKCLKTFKVPGGILAWAMYCEEEEKILFASFDDTIKEWNVKSETYLKKTKDTSTEVKVKWNFESLKLEDILACEEEEKILPAKIEINVNPRDSRERLKRDRNEIQIISRETGETIRTIINIPGLFIQGCSFKNLHPDSDLSEESKELLRQYGGKFE